MGARFSGPTPTKAFQFRPWWPPNTGPLGYTGRNGTSLGVLSALAKFGLTEEKNGRIVLTKDAVLILMKGGNEEQRANAIKRCALNPQLYKELWEEHSEAGSLPGDDTLKSLLVSDRDFNPKSVDKVIAAFRETIKFADLSMGAENGDSEVEEQNSDGSSDVSVPLKHESPIKRAVGMNQDSFTLHEGKVILQWPASLSQESYDDLKDWFDLMSRRIRRSVVKSATPDSGTE